MTEPSPTQYVPPGEPQRRAPEPGDASRPDGSAGVQTSGMAIAALVTGICGLIICPFFASIPAIVFGAIGMRDTRNDPNLDGRGMAIAGLVTGIVGTSLSVILIIIVMAIGIAEENDNDRRDYYHPPPGRDYNFN